MNKESNGYTFGFAIVMVIVVGALLSLAAMNLKPYQVENQIQEKMVNILKTIEVTSTMQEAREKFNERITERVLINYQGEELSRKSGDIDRTDPKDAFNVDVRKEFRSLSAEERNYPLYVAKEGGTTYYIIPMVGKGLWGPIWGYIALESDYNTIFGAVFDHKSETPGLGAEINQLPFQRPFKGKNILDDRNEFKSVVVKKGGATPGSLHEVDAITGGTITSNGVSEMIERTLATYVEYFNKKK